MLFLCITSGKNLDEKSFRGKMKNRCKDCLNKKVKCELCERSFTKKRLTTHIEQEHRYEPNSNVIEKPIIDNVNIKNRTLLVGPSFLGKTYLMLKILSRIPNQDFYIITKSPPGQYSNAKIKTKERSDEIKPLSEHENGIKNFDDILGSSNNRFIDQFFIRRRHNNLDFYYLSQSFFDLPKRTIRNNSNKIILFNQTLKYIDYIYRDVAGCDKSYDEIKQLCRKTWEEDYN